VKNAEQQEAAAVAKLVKDLKENPNIARVGEPEMSAEGKLNIKVYVNRPFDRVAGTLEIDTTLEDT